MKNLNLDRTILFAASLLLQLSPLCFHSHAASGDLDLSFDPGSGVQLTATDANQVTHTQVIDGLGRIIETHGPDPTGATVTLTDRHSELTGTLQTPAGSPAPDYFVIAFPANRAWWRPEARRIQTTRPASDGRFVLRDLPAGDYLLAALLDVEPADLGDPGFLEQAVPGAVKVTVADGERRTQNLQMAR